MEKSNLANWAMLRNQIALCAKQRNEPVVCSAGEVTQQYLDLKTAFSVGAWLRPLADCMHDHIGNLQLPYWHAIGGPTMGADAVSHAIACLHWVQWFSVRDEPKNHGMRKLIEGAPLTHHSCVVLIDDVVSSGASLRKAYNAVCATGARVIAVVPIVDRAGRVEPGAFPNYRPLFTHHELGIDPL